MKKRGYNTKYDQQMAKFSLFFLFIANIHRVTSTCQSMHSALYGHEGAALIRTCPGVHVFQ